MKRRAVERWWGLMTVMGMAASCRDHVPVCGGVECEASLETMAGAGPHDEVKAGEAGGAAAEPACSSDTECDNDLTCDGEEHCREGRCEPGEPVSCPLGVRLGSVLLGLDDRHLWHFVTDDWFHWRFLSTAVDPFGF